jgi:type IV secretion system protein VirB11
MVLMYNKPSGAVLMHHSEIFLSAMMREGCTELVVNGIDNAFIEINGQWSPAHGLATTENIKSFFLALASYSSASFDKNQPLLSASLPSGERVQGVQAPVVADFALSIRKPSTLDLDFDAYAQQGAFKFDGSGSPQNSETVDRSITALLKEANIKEAIELMVKAKKTIIISGGTSSGKTTFFNALAKLIDLEERLITIEDTREINLIQPNRLYLVAQRNSNSATFNTLLEACLRLRPDRILAAELRGPLEALAFLEGANTGHPGSISTVHSNSTTHTIRRLTMMLMRANIGLAQKDIISYVKDTVDVFIHFDRDRKNRRSIREVSFGGEVYKK